MVAAPVSLDALSAAQDAAVRRACARLHLPVAETVALLAAASAVEREMTLCAFDRSYFINSYCQIYDAPAERWIPFHLWAAQEDVLAAAETAKQFVALKARQLGLTWLFLAVILHDLIFRPIATDLVFSKREDEALYLLGPERLRGMYERLPDWMKPGIEVDSARHFKLMNGSSARAFPSNAGDSYTATRALVDEADLLPDLKTLLGRVQPTIDAGGQIVLISRPDKDKPQSHFKKVYKGGRDGENEWTALFIPWRAHPDRDDAWYQARCRDALANEGTLDSVYEQYPATDSEALSGRTLNLRIPPAWLEQVYQERRPLPLDVLPAGAPTYAELRVFRLPEKKQRYVIGADPAEGNPTSDDSALSVQNYETGEEVACLSGKLQPEQLAAAADRIGVWYNNAPVMPERNNHGHAFILWIRDNGKIRVLDGVDKKPGWHSTTVGKAMLYDTATETIKEQNCIIHDAKTHDQLGSIQGATLRAPDGEMDDAADAWALANVGRVNYKAFWMEVW